MDAFHFKQFDLYHSRSSQKISTDSVLLGAYATHLNYTHVLDVGCGCGILSFMLAQNTKASILGIDIHEDSINEALANLELFPFQNKMSFQLKSFQEKAQFDTEKFDLIISNPPYFLDALKSPITSRNMARHADHNLTFEDFAESAHQCLTENGTIALILPLNEMREMTISLSKYHIFPYHEVFVFPTPRKNANRMIRFFIRHFPETLQKEDLLIRDENNQYTLTYQELTHDFLLG